MSNRPSFLNCVEMLLMFSHVWLEVQVVFACVPADRRPPDNKTEGTKSEQERMRRTDARRVFITSSMPQTTRHMNGVMLERWSAVRIPGQGGDSPAKFYGEYTGRGKGSQQQEKQKRSDTSYRRFRIAARAFILTDTTTSNLSLLLRLVLPLSTEEQYYSHGHMQWTAPGVHANERSR